MLSGYPQHKPNAHYTQQLLNNNFLNERTNVLTKTFNFEKLLFAKKEHRNKKGKSKLFIPYSTRVFLLQNHLNKPIGLIKMKFYLQNE